MSAIDSLVGQALAKERREEQSIEDFDTTGSFFRHAQVQAAAAAAAAAEEDSAHHDNSSRV
jgi:hypothetical protein